MQEVKFNWGLFSRTCRLIVELSYSPLTTCTNYKWLWSILKLSIIKFQIQFFLVILSRQAGLAMVHWPRLPGLLTSSNRSTLLWRNVWGRKYFSTHWMPSDWGEKVGCLGTFSAEGVTVFNIIGTFSFYILFGFCQNYKLQYVE